MNSLVNLPELELKNIKFQQAVEKSEADEIIKKNILRKIEIVDINQEQIILKIENSNAFKLGKEAALEFLPQIVAKIFTSNTKFELVHEFSKKPKKIKVIKDKNIIKSFDFANYYHGNFNKLIYNTAQKIINDGVDFNLLMIHSRSGMGKTHIANAICLELQKQDMTAEIIKPSSYNSQFALMLTKNDPNEKIEMINELVSYDILVFDDFQVYKSKPKTFEFINDIIEQRKSNNKFTIICSSETPEMLKNSFDERLISRIEEGIVLEIQTPSNEEYFKILCFMLEKANWEIELFDEQALWDLIDIDVTNIIKIKGMTRLLTTFANDIKKHKFYSKQVLSNYFSKLKRKKPFDENTILNVIGNYYNIPVKNILSKTRKANIVKARHIIMYFLTYKMKYTQLKIAQLFNCDHSAVAYAVKKVEKERDSSSVTKAAIKAIDTLINE